MHSWPIMVESMSAISSFLRRVSASWLDEMSIGRAADGRADIASSAPRYRWRRAEQSQAMPSARRVEAGGLDLIGARRRAGVRTGPDGWATSVATKAMMSRKRSKAGRDADRRSDGQRQVRAGGAAGARARRRGGQCRLACRSTTTLRTVLTARPHAGGYGRVAAPALRPCRRRRAAIPPATMRREVDGAGRRNWPGSAALPVFVGGTGLYFQAR
jgi:hypothetical protein